jgi:hypothetical protein
MTSPEIEGGAKDIEYERVYGAREIHAFTVS